MSEGLIGVIPTILIPYCLLIPMLPSLPLKPVKFVPKNNDNHSFDSNHKKSGPSLEQFLLLNRPTGTFYDKSLVNIPGTISRFRNRAMTRD